MPITRPPCSSGTPRRRRRRRRQDGRRRRRRRRRRRQQAGGGRARGRAAGGGADDNLLDVALGERLVHGDVRRRRCAVVVVDGRRSPARMTRPTIASPGSCRRTTPSTGRRRRRGRRVVGEELGRADAQRAARAPGTKTRRRADLGGVVRVGGSRRGRVRAADAFGGPVALRAAGRRLRRRPSSRRRRRPPRAPPPVASPSCTSPSRGVLPVVGVVRHLRSFRAVRRGTFGVLRGPLGAHCRRGTRVRR